MQNFSYPTLKLREKFELKDDERHASPLFYHNETSIIEFAQVL